MIYKELLLKKGSFFMLMLKKEIESVTIYIRTEGGTIKCVS